MLTIGWCAGEDITGKLPTGRRRRREKGKRREKKKH